MELFYGIILYAYVCSILLYFYDFVQQNRKVNRVAFWLLFVVWSMQVLFYIYTVMNEHTLPLHSPSDTLFLYALLLISLSLVINHFFKMDLLLFITNMVAFSVLALSLFLKGSDFSAEMNALLHDEWVFTHISMAMFSYAAFTLSCILSLLYLLQYKMLKKKKWGFLFRRFPGLLKLDQYAYRLNLLAWPLLLLSLILGGIWAYYTLNISVWSDIKVLFSLLVISVYVLYFYQKKYSDSSGRKMALLNVICFSILLINYVFSRQFSDFHM